MFTPGPWHWDSDLVKGDPLGRVRYRVTTVGKTIAQTYYSSGDPNAEADARLIAAAPDLYEALKPFAEIDLTQGFLPPDFGFLVLRARAALAKAEGK